MSNNCKQKQQSCRSDIHGLLLAAEAAQKADIMTYSSGHLGPRSLNQSQPPEETKQFFWETSHCQEETLNSAALKKRHAKILACVKKKEMKESPSANTSGTPFVESGFSRPRQDQAKDCSSHAVRGEDTSLIKMGCSSNSLSEQLKASSLKESVTLPEPKRNPQFSSSHTNREDLKNESQVEMERWLDRQVTGEQEVCARGSVAEVHERKLQEELKKLSAQSWPSRDRLAVFSDVFDDVCEGSPVFGRILREIKTDYDLYVDHLMASQSSQHNMLLYTPVEDIGEVRETQLDDAEKEVCRLEREVKKALEDNKRAHHELQNIPAIKGPEDSDEKNASLTRLQGSGTVFGHADVVQCRRLQVLNVWKEIQQLEMEFRERLVSTDTTAATERRVKDVKTETVKLLASNDRLRTVSKDLENNINVVLNREKASKFIRRMLWGEIHSDLQTEGEQLHHQQTK
ncbi:uncharacterized protein PAE49_018922 isoform 2-T2 [Odontesthes bonariensis]